MEQNNQYYQPNQPQQPQYQQPAYQQPQYQQPFYDPTREVMSVGSYILMFILSSIPVVNIICWIVWLVSPDANKNKKNFIKAIIVIYAISILIGVISVVVMAVAGVSLAEIGGASLY